jgi:hypothetical protein
VGELPVLRTIPIASLLWLTTCASPNGVNPDIDYRIIFSSVISECDRPISGYADPSAFMEVGFTKVQAACEIFFDDATRSQQNAQAANRGLDVLLVAATAVINPTVSAAAAAKAITITTAGIVFSKALIDDYNTVYAFGNYLYKVKKLTRTSMEDYMSKARAAPPANYCLAYTYVQKLAMLCSLSSLKASLDEQVALPSTSTPAASATAREGRSANLRESRSAPRSIGAGPPPIDYSVRHSVEPR